MPLIDHFGLLAPFYDRVIQLRTPQELINHLALPFDGNLLDVGGGTGRVAQALNGFARHVVVFDESRLMLSQAQAKPGLKVLCGQSEKLPFFDNTFDRILMVDALHHVADQKRTCVELWRVLRPGGRLVIEEPDLRTFPVKLIAIAEKLALMRSRFLNPAAISALFTDQRAVTNVYAQANNAWIVVEKINAS